MSGRSAVLAGGTGLVGGYCLEELLAAGFTRVLVLTRRPIELKDKRVEQRPAAFDRLSAGDLQGVTHAFCALGTTIRKAGSQEAFRRVDLEYPRALAAAAAQAGAVAFSMVSSVGADSRSGNFYLRVKGEVEEAVMAFPFRSVHIFRPSFLLGPRGEARLAEKAAISAAQGLRFALIGGLRKYRPVHARTVAQAMVAASEEGSGRHVYHYDEIVQLAGRKS